MPHMLERLDRRARRGSKPRCHRLTHGSPNQVAAHLTSLIAPWGVVSPADRWMPQGFDQCTEAQLHTAHRLVAPAVRRSLAEWWLPADQAGDRTPNFDIASTCSIDSASGLLLIEAKSHDQELLKEAAGRKVDRDPRRAASQVTIGAAIDAARQGLNQSGSAWGISHRSHYQLSNRFAWAWKVAEQGIPVILVYLGFLGCNEMVDRGRPFATAEEWESLVVGHSNGIVPASAWNSRLSIAGVPMIPLIRSIGCPYDSPYPDPS